MTTTPAPPAGPALDPPGSPPPRRPVDVALAALVADGTLTAAQAQAVVSAVARAEGRRPAGLSVPPANVAPTWRGRLLEAAVYLGSAFVLAAVGLVVQQQWSAMSRATQLVLVGGLTAGAWAAGLAVAWPVRPRRGQPGDATHAVRRRSASVVLTLAVALATATTALLGEGGRWVVVAAWAVAGVLATAVHLLAPSVLSELAAFTAGAALMLAIPDAAMPAPRDQGPDTTYSWAAVDMLRGGLLLGYGAIWAWLVSHRVPHRELAITLGLAAALIGATTTTGRGQVVAPVLLGVIALAAVLTYLRDPVWPWVVGAVGAVFFAVVVIGNRTLGPALTFLVAGVVLLGGTATAVVLGRRRAARSGRTT